MDIASLIEAFGGLPPLTVVSDIRVRQAVERQRQGDDAEIAKYRAQCETLIGFTHYRMPKFREAPLHRFVAAQLERVSRREITRLMLRLPPRHFKQIADSEMVPTPNGWVRHGDLRPGDRVFGSEGRPITVMSVTGPQIVSVSIRFTDGSSVVTHPDHLWTVFDRGEGEWRTVDTRWLMSQTLMSGRNKPRARFQLPLRPVLQYPEADLPMAPYAFGAWLGDGTSTASAITHDARDAAIIDGVTACGYASSAAWTHRTTGVVTTSFGSGQPRVRGLFRRHLVAAGVLGNKHIPDAYKQSSVRQRLQFLAGLIDTDGHVDRRTSRVRISTTLKHVADGVAEIVRSLGWRACVTEAEQNPSHIGEQTITPRLTIYQVGFNPSFDIPTRLARKRITRFARQRRVGVAAIEPCKPEIGRCIMVDADDGLYVVGRDMIVTHNSQMASKSYPSFCLGHYPDRQFIAASANAKLADDFGREVRNIVGSERYKAVFDTRLAPDSKAAGKWNTTAGGCWYSVGVGGDILGRGADDVLIDDPYGSMQDARSEAIRKSVQDWYFGTIYNRLEPDGAIVIIGHRMHEADLQGVLEEKMRAHDSDADQWDIVELPAIAHDDDIMGRAKGEPLWPGHFGLAELERIRRNTPARDWSALYDQNPVPQEGEMFAPDNIAIRGHTSDVTVWCRGWDFSGTVDGDWTVGAKVGRTRSGRFVIGDICRFRGRPDAVEQKLAEVTRADGRGVKVSIPKDPAAAGLAWADRMILLLAGYQVEATPERGEKETRASSFAAQVNSFHVEMVAADWHYALREELRSFPSGRYDDQVDATSRAFNVVASMRRSMEISDEALRAM